MPTRCELCEDPLDRGHDLIGGMALCRRCFLGDLQGVAAARGWSLWSRHSQLVLRNDDNQVAYLTQVRIVVAKELALRVRVQRHRWWMTLLGLVRRRARSNDPLFEAHVRVWTPDPAQAEGFMRRDGVESSLFEVLGNLPPSYVEIRGGSVTVYYCADDPHTEGEIVVRAGVLALHVERFAVDDEPARPAAPRGPG